MNKFSITFSTVFIIFGLNIGMVSANDTFDKHCASCHNGGGNLINPQKTLSKQHLADNGVDNIGSISALISNGKPPMPAFGKSLSDKEIADVAQYVLDQAAAGWK